MPSVPVRHRDTLTPLKPQYWILEDVLKCFLGLKPPLAQPACMIFTHYTDGLLSHCSLHMIGSFQTSPRGLILRCHTAPKICSSQSLVHPCPHVCLYLSLLCTCICIYVYVYIYIYIHTHTHTHTHMYMYIVCAYMDCVYAYMHICVYTYEMYVHIYIYIYIYIYKCIYTNTHVHTYMHTQTQTLTHKSVICVQAGGSMVYAWMHEYIYVHTRTYPYTHTLVYKYTRLQVCTCPCTCMHISIYTSMRGVHIHDRCTHPWKVFSKTVFVSLSFDHVFPRLCTVATISHRSTYEHINLYVYMSLTYMAIHKYTRLHSQNARKYMARW
jgi:hypothetical protein